MPCQFDQYHPTASTELQDDFIIFENPAQYQTSQASLESSQLSVNEPACNGATVRSTPSSDMDINPFVCTSKPQASSSHSSQSSSLINVKLPHRKEPSGLSNFEFVAEDPTTAPARPDKTPRSKDDLEKQKQENKVLREFGGACLWCYRSKKRCGPVRPCPSCVTNCRKCIRNSAELQLSGLMTQPDDSGSCPPIFGPPSMKEADMLRRMGNKSFEKVNRFDATISFRRQDRKHPLEEPWVSTSIMDVTKRDIILAQKSTSAVDQFIRTANNYAPSAELAELNQTYSSDPIAHAALELAALFISIGRVSNSQIHVRPCDIDRGRFILYLILAVGSQKLVEISESISADLCHALRRNKKGFLGRLTWRPRPRESYPLDPVWVAAAIYYRVVSSLLDLAQTSPVMETIWMPLEEHLLGLRENLWSILKVTYNGKGTVKKVLQNEIPTLSISRSFDLAFQVDTTDFDENPSQQAALRGPGDHFAAPSWDMESFLSNEFEQDWLPYVPQIDTVSTIAPILASMTERIPKMPATPIIRPQVLEDIFDQLVPTPWDMMPSLDAYIHADDVGRSLGVINKVQTFGIEGHSGL